MTIGYINSYAAFPTFVWTGEYRSRIYAVEMVEEDSIAAPDDEESIVFDTVEDGPSTSTDMEEKQPTPDEGMIVTGNEPSDDTDTDVIFITSYDKGLIEQTEEEQTEEPDDLNPAE